MSEKRLVILIVYLNNFLVEYVHPCSLIVLLIFVANRFKENTNYFLKNIDFLVYYEFWEFCRKFLILPSKFQIFLWEIQNKFEF